MRLDIRQIHALKNKNNLTGVGVPNSGEGSDGEIRLQKTNNGVKLYAKYSGEWFAFSPDEGPSKSTAGNIELPGGFIMKYGSHITDANTETVTFDTPFPNGCSAVFLTAYKDSPPTGGGYDHGVVSFTNTGFVASTVTGWEKLYYLAIGN